MLRGVCALGWNGRTVVVTMVGWQRGRIDSGFWGQTRFRKLMRLGVTCFLCDFCCGCCVVIAEGVRIGGLDERVGEGAIECAGSGGGVRKCKLGIKVGSKDSLRL